MDEIGIGAAKKNRVAFYPLRRNGEFFLRRLLFEKDVSLLRARARICVCVRAFRKKRWKAV